MKEQQDPTRARFLGEIAQRFNPETIAEVHLFQPMKQGGVESGVAVVAVVESAPGQSEEAARHTRLGVYTAKYRLTLKGPDRGKWEFALNPEADAPLVTVDAVVRGVQRRSGDAEDPAKLSGEEFRSVLPSSQSSPST
jgi:hypothetical protein